MNKTGEYVECRVCGKSFYKTQTRLIRSKGKHYCSHKCQDIGRHMDSIEERKCEYCNSLYIVSKKSKQRFCSEECQHKWQKTQTGILNKRCKRRVVQCDWCKKNIFVKQYKTNIQSHHFCDINCRRLWYSNVYSKTDEWRDMSRQRAVQLLEQKVVNTETSPQKSVNKILDNLNISYKREYGITYYSIDNYLDETGLMIEVMGDYWHANPNKYSADINSIQINSIHRDKRKHTYVYKYYNVEILYIWEYDIKHNYDLCVMLIQYYVENYGNIKNYHSFNYHIDENNNIKLNKDIIIPFHNL